MKLDLIRIRSGTFSAGITCRFTNECIIWYVQIDTRHDDCLSVGGKCESVAMSAWPTPNFTINYGLSAPLFPDAEFKLCIKYGML